MERVTFDLLNVLVAAAESKNFREAAAKLGISQPAVSLKLRELEATQPVPLFSLDGRRKVLTPFGKALCEVAKDESISLGHRIEHLQRAYSSEDLLNLRVGGRHEVLQYLSPFLTFGGKLEYVACGSSEAVERLLRRDLDIAISYVRPDSPRILAKKLFLSCSVFTVHKKFLRNQPLIPDWTANRDFLTKTPCIFYQRDGQLITEWTRRLGIDPADLQVKFVANEWRIVQDLVDQGTGFSIVPSYVRSYEKQVQRLELTGFSPFSFYALYERDLRSIPALRSFLAQFGNFALKPPHNAAY